MTFGSRPRRGFSLVELLVVIAILGILSGIGLVTTLKWLEHARLESTEAQLTALSTAIEEYRIHTGRFPDRGTLYQQLNDRRTAGDANWSGPYLTLEEDRLDVREQASILSGDPLPILGEAIADAWGRPIYYIPRRDYAEFGIEGAAHPNPGDDEFGDYERANSFVLISAGPDGKLRTFGSHFAPMPWRDGRDNDGDGMIDEFETRGHAQGPGAWAEDDLVNY